MVSQENVELSRESFEAFRLGGIEALLPFYAPDIVLHSVPGWVEDSVYRGHNGARRMTAVWTDNFDDWGREVPDIRSAEYRVVALAEMTRRIKDSGVPIRQPIGLVSSFRDGRISEIHFFLDWQQALKAVGWRSRRCRRRTWR